MLDQDTDLGHQFRAEQRSPITLSTLFYLVTVAAIMAACVRFIQSDSSVTVQQIIFACIIAAITGMSLGFCMWIRGIAQNWAAPILGLALGAVVGPLLCVRLTHFSELIGMSFLGSWLLIVLMCITARFSMRQVRSSDSTGQ